MKGATEKATFGGGCFWHVETAFRGVRGVVSACVGYMGGTLENPTYEDVCTGLTGYAEVAYVDYDPAIVSTRNLSTSSGKFMTPPLLIVPLDFWRARYNDREIAQSKIRS